MSRNGSTSGIASAIRSATGSGRSERALVVGGGHVGRTVASHLNEEYDTAFVSRSISVVGRIAREGVTAHHVEDIDAKALDDADAADASLAIVAAEDDGVTFLVAQLLRTRFDVDHIVARVDDREKIDSFDDLEVETVFVPDLLVDEVTERLETVADDVTDG